MIVLMAPKKQLSAHEKQSVIRSLASGLSSRQVGRNFDIDHKTVLRIQKKFVKSGTTERASGSGRPRLTTAQDGRVLARIVKADPLKTASDVKKHASENLNLNISSSTARRILR